MVYVSSICLRKKNIAKSVEAMAKNGFRYMELSAGTDYYGNAERRILSLKNKYSLNYLCHNYFPPLKNPLVLNMASLNDDIYKKTINSLTKAIMLSKRLGANKFGLHAGFFLDFKVKEIGKKISYSRLFDKDKCLARFCDGFKKLKAKAGDLEVYIENNVISYANLKTFKGITPVMLVDYCDYLELKKRINFKLLLDIGHLKVSAQSLGLNFKDELRKMIAVSDYLHISDNNGLADQNRPLSSNSSLYQELKKYNFRNKIAVLEIYSGIKEIRKSFMLIEELLNA